MSTILNAVAAWMPLVATLAVVSGGFLLGAIAGLVLGVAGTECARAARLGRLPVRLLGSLPGRAAVVLAVAWAGRAWWSGLAEYAFPLAIWLGCLPVASAVLAAGERLPRAWLETFSGFGATRLERLVQLRLPAAAPALVRVLAPAYVAALVGVLAAELLGGTGAGGTGAGGMAGAGGWLRARVAAADAEGALVGVALLAVAGAAIAAALRWLARRHIRWSLPTR